MGTSVAELIADRIGAMPASERRAAQTLIANYPLIGLKTVAEFSQQAGVSSPTILRFVAGSASRTIPNSRRPCRTSLPRSCNRPSRAADRHQPSPRRGFRRSRRGDARQHPRDVPAYLEQADRRHRDAACRPRRKAFLVGGRFTDPIARYMAAHLTMIRPNVFHLAGQESNWRDRLIDMGKRDVLLIFDIRRYQDSLVRFAEKAHQRGVQIVLFTDQWLSPIARFARHVIAGRTAVPSPWDSSAALFVVAEALIGELTRQLEADSARRIREMENLR